MFGLTVYFGQKRASVKPFDCVFERTLEHRLHLISGPCSVILFVGLRTNTN